MITSESAAPPRVLAWQGIGVILVASVLFGAMAVSVRLAARDMSALPIAFVRFSGSLLVLLLVNRGSLRPQRANAKGLLLRGALGASAIMLYYVGIQGAGAGLATLLHCTYPIPTAILSVWLMGERPSRSLLTAVALNLAGLVIVMQPTLHLGSAAARGAVCCLLSSMLAGGAVTTARHLRSSENAALITTYFMLVGTLVTAPSLIGGWPPITLPLALALLAVVLTSVAGQWLLHHGLGFTSATQGSLACAVSVVTAAGLEALLLGEPLRGTTFIGGSLMVAAVGLAAVRGR